MKVKKIDKRYTYSNKKSTPKKTEKRKLVSTKIKYEKIRKMSRALLQWILTFQGTHREPGCQAYDVGHSNIIYIENNHKRVIHVRICRWIV